MSKNNKVFYIGWSPCGRVEKILNSKKDAHSYHLSLKESGINIKSYKLFPVDYAGVKIDRLSHLDVEHKVIN